MYSSTVSLTSALDGMGSQRHATATLPREKPGILYNIRYIIILYRICYVVYVHARQLNFPFQWLQKTFDVEIILHFVWIQTV